MAWYEIVLIAAGTLFLFSSVVSLFFGEIEKKHIILFFLLAISLVTCAAKNNPPIEQQLHQMLKERELFKLEALLKEKKSELPQNVVLYFELHLQNAFNQTGQSLQTIYKLLNDHGKSLNDTLLLDVFLVKYDNLLKQNRYKEAADAMKIAIEKYGYTSMDLTRLHNEYNTIELIKEFSPQKIHITDDVIIPASLNQYNHLIVKVISGGKSENFIFDTGATNVISESNAKRMGIRVKESFVTDIGAIDKKIKFKVGFADTLRIGNLVVENVIFKVMSDELLSFPEAGYVIHGIIGFPVIDQMKEIVIRKNESITVVAHPTKRNLHNLYLTAGHLPILQFEANSENVLFIMDTGANTSKFSEKYFVANTTKIREGASKNMMRRGGLGGFVDSETYELKNVQLKIGGQELIVPTIAVLTDKLSFLENYDGLLGQDVLTHFNKLILNYEDMYLFFED